MNKYQAAQWQTQTLCKTKRQLFAKSIIRVLSMNTGFYEHCFVLARNFFKIPQCGFKFCFSSAVVA